MPKRLADLVELVDTLRQAGIISPIRPDRYSTIIAAVRREGLTETFGFAMAAARCPDQVGLVDERGQLTWRELDEQSNALAAGLQNLVSNARPTIGIMCRNHRGFVHALVATGRIGANTVLLNTSFASPALAEVVQREDVEMIIYDDEFTDIIHRAMGDVPVRIVAWTDEGASASELNVDQIIATHIGQRPKRPDSKGKLILLTSGTSGTPKGAARSGGGPGALISILKRTPWRVGETTVVAAPVFHGWGFFQLVFSATMACTVVMQRKFDAEATLQMIDQHRATGLGLVPVMLDRIMALPDDVLDRYDCSSLRFASASGSRMRPDVVTAFMDRFGDVVYNNYNATETGMVATATPEDLRAAPDTAGRPAEGTTVRILDERMQEQPVGEVGTIYVRNNLQFDGYTSGDTKDFHGGFMSSGDLGYLDECGRLFVVGRDDEMIVSGGENVYPIEVEKVLTAHPDVVESAVIGVDDDQYGQRLLAYVVPTSGASIGPEELKLYVRENLANYKVPREITILDELPRSSTGKIVRRELLTLDAVPGDE